jgi:hypothetical protein
MQQFRTLLYREWRDSRLLVVGAFVAFVILEFAMSATMTGRIKNLHFLWSAILIGAFTADRFAGDIASHRAATLSPLPVPPGLVWFAKVVYLIATSISFSMLYWMAHESFKRLFYDRHGFSSMEPVDPLSFVSLLDAISVIGVVACASVFVKSGIVAFVLGGGFYMLAAIVGSNLNGAALWADLDSDLWSQRTAITIGSLVFLSLSYVVFCHVRMHSNKQRPALARGLYATAIFAIAAYSTAYAAIFVAIESFAATPPSIADFVPSPNGSFISLDGPEVDTKPLLDSESYYRLKYRESFVWILDVETGEFHSVRLRHTKLAPKPWINGQLCVVQMHNIIDAGDRVEYLVDPRDGIISEGPRPYRAGFHRSERKDGESPDRSLRIDLAEDCFEVRDVKTNEMRARLPRTIASAFYIHGKDNPPEEVEYMDPKDEYYSWLEGRGDARYIIYSRAGRGGVRRELLDLKTNNRIDLGITKNIRAVDPNHLYIARNGGLDFAGLDGKTIKTIRKF